MNENLIDNSLKIIKEAGRLADEAETPLLINNFILFI